MDLAATRTGSEELDELLAVGTARGYILLSELRELGELQDRPEGWIESLLGAVRDEDLEVVDDVAEPTVARPVEIESSGDPVRQYLNAIGRTELLTAEQEVDLAKRDRAGLAARALLTDEAGSLSPERRARLRRIDLLGRRAHDHMIRANLRLVVSVARRYRGRGLDLLDLVQEGNLGLMRAVEKFDHTRGYKFSTYATWWIRQALTRGLADKSRTLRLPVHVHETLTKLRWTELDLEQKLGRDPTEQELARALGLTLERLREIRHAARELISLDTPVGEESETTMGQLIADDRVADPERSAAFLLTQELVREVLHSLSERERGIVELRFGLSDGEVHTLEEVGQRYDVTRERIRQIEAKTLAKLRHPSRADRLRDLLDGSVGNTDGGTPLA